MCEKKFQKSEEPPLELDLQGQMRLVKKGPVSEAKAYFRYFRFDPKVEEVFVEKADQKSRMDYINRYGLYGSTVKHIIDQSKKCDEQLNVQLMAVMSDFIKLRHFVDDVDYLLNNASDQMLDLYLREVQLVGDEEVLKLLKRAESNPSLFASYVNHGRYISNDIVMTIVSSRNYQAFEAIAWRMYRRFKEKAQEVSYQEMLAKDDSEVMFPREIQWAVFCLEDDHLIRVMVERTPLVSDIQEPMFSGERGMELFRAHISNVYGIGGYRFEEGLEQMLFDKFAQASGADDAFKKFCDIDPVTYVRYASYKACLTYLKELKEKGRWLDDSAQVALVCRQNADLTATFVSTFNSEHGMCWEAEIKFAQVGSAEVIRSYVEFHTMCGEALDVLRQRFPELIEFYNNRHQW